MGEGGRIKGDVWKEGEGMYFGTFFRVGDEPGLEALTAATWSFLDKPFQSGIAPPVLCSAGKDVTATVIVLSRTQCAA